MKGSGLRADAGSRILLRQNQPTGFAVEANVLDNPFNLQVYHRPAGKPLYACLGEWSVLIPENIVTSRGVCLPNSPEDRLMAMDADPKDSWLVWTQAAGRSDTIFYEYEQNPPLTVTDIGASPEEMIDRHANLHFKASVAVEQNALDIELAITNRSGEPTSLFTHLCNRFMGRGYVWGWGERTYIQMGGEWVTPRAANAPAGKWFVQSNPPSHRIMEHFRGGSSNDPRARVTSPFVCMVSQNHQYTSVCGSPQGSMVFVNADNPCLHSDPYTPYVEPGGTAVQTWSMRIYELPYRDAISRFERELRATG